MRNRGFRLSAWALILGLVLLGIYPSMGQALTRTASWSAVTTYTDGAPIEVGNTVYYSLYMQDNTTKTITQVADKITGTSVTFDDSVLVKGRTYIFWGQTFLKAGSPSDNSVQVGWAVPLGQASPMGTITITP